MADISKELRKERALYDFKEIHYYQGYHAGQFLIGNEDEKEDSANEYLDNMKSFADEWAINYDPDLSHYIEDENEESYHTLDNMGYELFQLVVKKLLDVIRG